MGEKEIIDIVLDELNKRGMIKKRINTFETTKSLLKNMNRIENSIKHIDKQIKNLNSKASTLGNPKIPSALTYDALDKEVFTNITQIEERIYSLEQSKLKINIFIDYVKNIIETVLSKEEQKLLQSYYFDKKDVNDLCVDYDCEQSTIYRRLNKIINDIKVELFTEKFIDELYI